MQCSPTRRSTSSSVGMRSHSRPLDGFATISRDLSSASVMSLTQPVPFVVRSTRSSWMTTSEPSLESCTSSSIPVMSYSQALANDESVFSG